METREKRQERKEGAIMALNEMEEKLGEVNEMFGHVKDLGWGDHYIEQELSSSYMGSLVQKIEKLRDEIEEDEEWEAEKEDEEYEEDMKERAAAEDEDEENMTEVELNDRRNE